MMDIHSLLNPGPEGADSRPARCFSISPTPAFSTPQASAAPVHRPTTPHKYLTLPQRMQTSNDIMTSMLKADEGVQGRLQLGPVNFPPVKVFDPTVHANGHAGVLAKLKEFQFAPLGKKGEYVRENIPFASHSKDLYAKTGREEFHVYKYRFTTRKDKDKVKVWTVTWDYEVGLVRMTHFFKACEFGKTTPARAIDATDGLRDVALKITGGNIEAQGYWLPFECARALCRTFCWEIKEALTPIFGFNFAKECIRRDDTEYQNFRIGTTIVQHALQQQKACKAGSSSVSITSANNAGASPAPMDDLSPVLGRKQLRPRKILPIVEVDSFSEPNDEHEDEDEDKDEDDDPDVEDAPVGNEFLREDSMPVSPRSKPVTPSGSGWVSINKPAPVRRVLDPPKEEAVGPVFAFNPFSASRPSDASSEDQAIKKKIAKSCSPLPSKRGKKRVASPLVVTTTTTTTTTVGPARKKVARRNRSSSHSESDDDDIPLPPASIRRLTSPLPSLRQVRDLDMSQADYEVALALVDMSRADRGLSTGGRRARI